MDLNIVLMQKVAEGPKNFKKVSFTMLIYFIRGRIKQDEPQQIGCEALMILYSTTPVKVSVKLHLIG